MWHARILSGPMLLTLEKGSDMTRGWQDSENRRFTHQKGASIVPRP